MRKKIKEFYQKDWTNTERVMVTVIAALAGIVLGFILAPSRSKTFGCNNGNQYGLQKPEEMNEEPDPEEVEE